MERRKALKLPNGRALTGQSHDYKRHGTTTCCSARSRQRQMCRASKRRAVSSPRLMNRGCRLPDREYTSSSIISTPIRRRSLAQETSKRPLHSPRRVVVAQSDRDLVPSSRPIAERRIVTSSKSCRAYRCIISAYNETATPSHGPRGLPARQKSPYHPAGFLLVGDFLPPYGAVFANIQAPYPTTRSREPAVSPELHNESRLAVRPRRPASTSKAATARQPQAWFGLRLAQSPRSMAAAVAKSRRRAVS